MNTKRRLDQVFEKAFPIPFDNSSKFVFFSDMHRGDDSLPMNLGEIVTSMTMLSCITTTATLPM